MLGLSVIISKYMCHVMIWYIWLDSFNVLYGSNWTWDTIQHYTRTQIKVKKTPAFYWNSTFNSLSSILSITHSRTWIWHDLCPAMEYNQKWVWHDLCPAMEHNRKWVWHDLCPAMEYNQKWVWHDPCSAMEHNRKWVWHDHCPAMEHNRYIWVSLSLRCYLVYIILFPRRR